MRHLALIETILFCTLMSAAAQANPAARPETVEVNQEDTLAYQEPSFDAAVLRRLYRGELPLKTSPSASRSPPCADLLRALASA